MKTRRPKTFSNGALLAAREGVLEKHLNEVCEYLAVKSRDPQMVIELMHVASVISINIYKSTRKKKQPVRLSI